MKIKVNYVESCEFKNASDVATYVGALNDLLNLLADDGKVTFPEYIKVQEKTKELMDRLFVKI